MHKGNIMKFTEGAFKDWGYELAATEFGAEASPRTRMTYKSAEARGASVVIKDRIADSMFQQIQLRPDEYSVIATPNLNGDYISDALAAQVGGIGMAAGANIGDKAAMFEATHGTAPKYAGKDKVNPGSLHALGGDDAEPPRLGRGCRSDRQLARSNDRRQDRHVRLRRLMDDATEVSCSGFGQAMIERM